LTFVKETQESLIFVKMKEKTLIDGIISLFFITFASKF